MDKYYELSEESIEKFYEIFNNKSFPIGIRISIFGKWKTKRTNKNIKNTPIICFFFK